MNTNTSCRGDRPGRPRPFVSIRNSIPVLVGATVPGRPRPFVSMRPIQLLYAVSLRRCAPPPARIEARFRKRKIEN